MRVSPKAAFACLADPVIDPGVRSCVPDALPMRAGTVNTVRARLNGLPLMMKSRTVEWDEDRRMVMESVRPARPVRAVAIHLFEPHPDGVRYTWSMEMIPAGPGGGLAARLMTVVMRRNARRQQTRFKAAVEAAARGPG